MAFKNKKCVKDSSNKYLRPGALAQFRYNSSASQCCIDIRRKRVVLDSRVNRQIAKKKIIVNFEKIKMDLFPLADINHQSRTPVTFSSNINFMSPAASHHAIRQVKMQESPRTPSTVDSESCSFFESLPIELLVKILCHLHHDQLRAAFHVSRRIRSAAIIARQTYFNYTTPDRSRAELLSPRAPVSTEHWPFKRGAGKEGIRISSPLTPKAPRHLPCHSRLPMIDLKQVAAALFWDSALPSDRTSLPPRLLKPPSALEPLTSNRELFYEDELCKAVANNKLR